MVEPEARKGGDVAAFPRFFVSEGLSVARWGIEGGRGERAREGLKWGNMGRAGDGAT